MTDRVERFYNMLYNILTDLRMIAQTVLWCGLAAIPWAIVYWIATH